MAPDTDKTDHDVGGVFQLELFLPDDYPMCPPKIRFLTRIYHPNIDRLGRICLDVLKNNWSPALQIRTILLSIQALLGAPNPEDPLNEAVAKQWKVRQPKDPLIQCREGGQTLTNSYRRTSRRQSRLPENGRSSTHSRRNERLLDRSDDLTNTCHYLRLREEEEPLPPEPCIRGAESELRSRQIYWP